MPIENHTGQTNTWTTNWLLTARRFTIQWADGITVRISVSFNAAACDKQDAACKMPNQVLFQWAGWLPLPLARLPSCRCQPAEPGQQGARIGALTLCPAQGEWHNNKNIKIWCVLYVRRDSAYGHFKCNRKAAMIVRSKFQPAALPPKTE